jgi:hypothetical protein
MEEALSKLTPLRPQDGSVIAATRSRFSTCEYRCKKVAKKVANLVHLGDAPVSFGEYDATATWGREHT